MDGGNGGYSYYDWDDNMLDDPKVKEEVGDDDQRQKNLSQREKNREAVRNCRKRKKEHVRQLKERIDELVEENRKLKLELQLGGEHADGHRSSNENEQELIQEMQVLVQKAREEERQNGTDRSMRRQPTAPNGPPKTDAELALRRKIQLYMERHQDHGRDRQKAIGFILSRLQRLVEPESITKLYLHMMTSRGGLNFDSEELKELKEILALSPDQELEFAQRRRYVKRLRTELDCALDQMKSIVERCKRNKKVGDSLNELTRILRPEQFARFVVWVHSNPACKDILDELWDKLLVKCDLQINAEIQSNPAAVEQIKRFQQNSAALAMHLFSIPDPKARESIASMCVHPDVVLVDANNNVDKRGLKAVIRYMSYVTHAFDTQSCEKTKSLRALNVEDKRLESDPDDDKVTGTWRLSGVYIGRLRPRKHSPGNTDSPATPFGLSSSGFNVPSSGFTLPSSVTQAQGQAQQGSGTDFATTPSSMASSASSSHQAGSSSPRGPQLSSPSVSSVSSGGPPEPLLSKEDQKERTVSFNVMVEFSFADPKHRDLISEMVISWDALSLVNQLGLLKSPAKGVLPPPNLVVPSQSLGPSVVTSGGATRDGASSSSSSSTSSSTTGIPSSSSETGSALPSPHQHPRTLLESLKSFTEAKSSSNNNNTDNAPPPTMEVDSKRQISVSSPDVSVLEEDSVARQNAIKLATLFQEESPQQREKIAQELLDQRCTFDDIHMGIKYKGIPECLKYISRLRRAFPTFNITARVLSATKAQDARSTRRRAESRTSVQSGDDNQRQEPELFELKWEVAGFYGGSLVKKPRPCQINGKVFVTTSPLNSKILDAKLDVSAQNLMQQIGLLASSNF